MSSIIETRTVSDCTVSDITLRNLVSDLNFCSENKIRADCLSLKYNFQHWNTLFIIINALIFQMPLSLNKSRLQCMQHGAKK